MKNFMYSLLVLASLISLSGCCGKKACKTKVQQQEEVEVIVEANKKELAN